MKDNIPPIDINEIKSLMTAQFGELTKVFEKRYPELTPLNKSVIIYKQVSYFFFITKNDLGETSSVIFGPPIISPEELQDVSNYLVMEGFCENPSMIDKEFKMNFTEDASFDNI